MFGKRPGEIVARAVKGFERAAVLGGPCVDLAAAGLGEAHQAFEQAAAQQAEHRLGAHGGDAGRVALGRAGHGDVGVLAFGCAGQALGQVGREQRRVAGHGEQPGGVAMFQPHQKARERARVVGQAVGPYGRAESLVGREVAVGVHHGGAHLGLQAQQRIQRQGQAAKGLQALVHAAHARAAAAGEDQAGDVLGIDHAGMVCAKGARGAHPPM